MTKKEIRILIDRMCDVEITESEAESITDSFAKIQFTMAYEVKSLLKEYKQWIVKETDNIFKLLVLYRKSCILLNVNGGIEEEIRNLRQDLKI